jgi:hypothetical protein
MHRVASLLRHRLAVALGALTFMLAACGDPAGPLPRSGAPQRLEFRLYAWGAPSTAVLTVGDSVVFVRRSASTGRPMDSVSVVPSDEQWRTFWTTARAAGVTRWKDAYETDVLDGGGWSLHIGLDGRDIRSRGSNAWPNRLGGLSDGPSPEFEALVAAVGALVGRDIEYWTPPEL